MNVGVHVSFLILVSSGYMPGSGIIGSYGSFILVFKGISILFSIVAVSLQFFQRTFCEIIDFKMGALEAKKRLISPPDRAGPPQAHSGRLNDGRFSGKLLWQGAPFQGHLCVPLHRDLRCCRAQFEPKHSPEQSWKGEGDIHRACFSVVLNKWGTFFFHHFRPDESIKASFCADPSPWGSVGDLASPTHCRASHRDLQALTPETGGRSQSKSAWVFTSECVRILLLCCVHVWKNVCFACLYMSGCALCVFWWVCICVCASLWCLCVFEGRYVSWVDVYV